MNSGDDRVRTWIVAAVQMIVVIAAAMLFVARLEQQAAIIAVNLDHLTKAVSTLNARLDEMSRVTTALDKRMLLIERDEARMRDARRQRRGEDE